MTEHRKRRRYSDEFYCSYCNKRWDVNDTPPPCVQSKPESKLITQVDWDNLKAQLGIKDDKNREGARKGG